MEVSLILGIIIQDASCKVFPWAAVLYICVVIYKWYRCSTADFHNAVLYICVVILLERHSSRIAWMPRALINWNSKALCCLSKMGGYKFMSLCLKSRVSKIEDMALPWFCWTRVRNMNMYISMIFGNRINSYDTECFERLLSWHNSRVSQNKTR